MARKKQRETYGNGSITPKKGKDGKQAVDRKGNPIWRVCLTFGTETYVNSKGEQRKRQRKVQRVVHGTLAHLAMWKKFQANAPARIGMKEDGVPLFVQTDDTPVCCTDNGSWLDPTNLGRWWNRYRNEIGLPDFRMHELRHTQATILLGNGVDVKTVQTRLGHSTSALTLDQYAHAIPANDKAAADLMGSIYGKSANSHASQNPPESSASTRGLAKSA